MVDWVYWEGDSGRWPGDMRYDRLGRYARPGIGVGMQIHRTTYDHQCMQTRMPIQPSGLACCSYMQSKQFRVSALGNSDLGVSFGTPTPLG